MRRSWVAAVMLCLAFVLVNQEIVQAQTVLFGPKTYTRTAGPPNQFTDTFTLPAGTTAPYTLHIVNGNANGTNRISSATVTLNGTQILGPSDFGQNVAVIDRTVTLQPNNTLEIRLTSAPGSFITVSVLDTSAGSQPTALTPNPLNLNAGATGTLTATLAPAPTAAGTLAVNSANVAVATVPTSIPFTAGQTSVPITVTAVASGSTTVTATLNGSSAASQVTVTPPPPTITSFTPTRGPVGTTVTITGTNFINVQTVTFNGVTAIFTINNATTLTAVVPSGATTGNISVSDSAGTAQSATNFTVLPPPTVVSLLPATLTLTQGGNGTLTVTISAPQPTDTAVALTSSASTIVTVPNTVVVLATQTSAPVTVTAVAPGSAQITASLNATSASSTITVTSPPPTIASVTPLTGPAGTVVTITGTGFNPTAANNQIKFNGLSAIVGTVNASGTTLTTTVPQNTTTGAVTVTTLVAPPATGPIFTMAAPNFTIAALPAPLTMPALGQGSFAVGLAGTNGFTNLATLAVTGLPTGMTGLFSIGAIGSGQTALLTLTTTGTTPTGTYPLVVTATGPVNGVTTPRSVTATVQVLATGETTFSGLVLDEDAKPVKGALVKIGVVQVVTDDGGNFLMQNPPVGANQVLFIDGGPASTPQHNLPIIPYKVTIVAGQANALSFVPHLHFQKTTGMVDISNTGVERIVTDPELPGFQMRIPAGAQIIGWDGQPNTQMSVRRVPIDRLPVPPPPAGLFSTAAYMDYFGKPGGGTPTEPIPVTLPNDLDLPPGAQAELWYFDEAPDGSRPNQWAKYGTGTVSNDGSQIVPDIDPATGKQFGQPRFCCGINMAAIQEATRQFYFGGGWRAFLATFFGDPVDAATGLLVVTKTDLVLSGRLPVTLTRTYQTNGTVTGPFGRGTTHATQIVMLIEGNQRTLRFGDGRRAVLTLQPDGSYRNLTDGALQGAVLTSPSGVPTLRWKDGTRWVFGVTLNSAFGVSTLGLTQQIDRNGNTLTNTWSGANITAIAGPEGRALTLEYDGAGRITKVTDPIGRAVQYAYDGAGNLATVTDPEGGTTRYAYDSNNRMTRITDAKGITFLQNFYGPSGRVLRQIQADGSEYRFRYQLTGGTSSGAGCTVLTGNLVSVVEPFVRCPTVDSWENLQAGYTITGGAVTGTTVVDPRGNATTSRFNPRGYPMTTTDAVSQTRTSQRNAANHVTASLDPLGRTTAFGYDPAGNVTRITDPTAQSTALAYQSLFNRVTTITDALNHITAFSYDPANGNLLSVTDPRNQVTTIADNSVGQPTSVQGPIATEPPTTFTYDTNGNLITTTDPLGNATQRTYDAVSRLTALTDPRGLQTQFRYDGLNRVTEIADARQGITRFTYDPNGNLLTVTDAKNQTTTYTYDTMDRLAMRTDALGRIERYEYDLAGNLVRFTDRKNQVTTFAYDALNRRTTATYADSTTTFTYDSVGRLTKASDTATGAGTIDFAYDTLDRLIQEVTGQGSVNYQYDVLGRRTNMTANGQQPVTYTYDPASRLTQVAQGSLSVGLGYDNANRRTSLTYPNGTSTSYTYDVASRLTNINHIGPSGIIEALTYQYDAAGNRTSLTRNNGTASLLPAAVASATYDAANEQTAFAGATLQYDANGNLTNDGVNTYVWDARNRLASISGGATSNFVYDPLGRRTSKTINSVVSQFAYDGNDIVAEIGGGAVGANYLRSLNIDELFGILRQDGVYFSIYDGLSSTLALTNQAGTSTVQYSYEPFGKAQSSNPTFANPFQFTGRENDNTGLYYYRARYYSPSAHRFIGLDPLGFQGGSANFYSYGMNSPANFIDPLGLTYESNWNFFWDWALGTGQRIHNYGPGDTETQEIQNSVGADLLRQNFYNSSCKNVTDFAYGSFRAYWDTVVNPLTSDLSSTATQVGGFASASAVKNADSTVTYTIPNKAGTHSFFYHVVPDRSASTGPMSTITQTFRWTEPISSSSGRKDSKCQ